MVEQVDLLEDDHGRESDGLRNDQRRLEQVALEERP